MQKKSLLIDISAIAVIILMLYLSIKVDISYLVTSTVIVIASMIPAYFSFENRKPDARELVIVAIFVALSVASRVVFMAIPYASPVMAMIMIAGFAFGPQIGFINGSMTALVSNVFFGQGSWTPWQMLAYGLAGLIAGAFAKGKLIDGKNRITSAILGFILVLFIVGPILDISFLFIMMPSISLSVLIKVLISGISVNLTLAISTMVTLIILSGPMLKKMERVKIKYGVLI